MKFQSKYVSSLRNAVLLLAVMILTTPAFAQQGVTIGDTCSADAVRVCSTGSTSLTCRLNPVACGAAVAECQANFVKQCLSSRTATATYYVKYNTAGADFNFLEVSNLSQSESLVGAYRIYDTDGKRIGSPVEFNINKRGRMDFDIHSQVGPQVYGQLEISIYSINNAASVYSSFYNQRSKPTATGVFLDQTVTVKGEKGPE